MADLEQDRKGNGVTDLDQHVPETATDHKRLNARTEEEIRDYRLRTKQEISDKISQLETAWDVERTLQATATALSMVGLGLGARRRGWLALPAVSLGLLAWQSIQGWNPTVPLFKRFGLRTRDEMDKEIVALKIMRGDFKKAHNKGERPRAQRVIEAVTGTEAEENLPPPDEQIM